MGIIIHPETENTFEGKNGRYIIDAEMFSIDGLIIDVDVFDHDEERHFRRSFKKIAKAKSFISGLIQNDGGLKPAP